MASIEKEKERGVQNGNEEAIMPEDAGEERRWLGRNVVQGFGSR